MHQIMMKIKLFKDIKIHHNQRVSYSTNNYENINRFHIDIGLRKSNSQTYEQGLKNIYPKISEFQLMDSSLEIASHKFT